MRQSWLPWERTTRHGLREMRMHAKSSTLIFSCSPHPDSEDPKSVQLVVTLCHSCLWHCTALASLGQLHSIGHPWHCPAWLIAHR
jgi:hypothetical protein